MIGLGPWVICVSVHIWCVRLKKFKVYARKLVAAALCYKNVQCATLNLCYKSFFKKFTMENVDILNPKTSMKMYNTL